MNQRDRRITFFIIFVLLGVVITVQSKTILKITEKNNNSKLKIDIVKEQLLKEKEIGTSLKNSINQNTKKKEEYLNLYVNNIKDTKIKPEWNKTMSKAGLTDVIGNGIKIKLSDATIRTSDINAKFFVIHDSDIIKILNELKKSKCQAISINGERIISNSETVCAGPTIKINKKRFAVPFEIKAIGNPDILFDTLDSSSIVYSMRQSNIKIEISKEKNLNISKYEGNIQNLISGLEVLDK